MSRASKVKGSRLKSSTKNIYNDVLKNHFLEWLRQNQNNATVKKFKNVFKLNRRNEHGFTIHKMQQFIIIFIFMALMGVQSKNFQDRSSQMNYKI